MSRPPQLMQPNAEPIPGYRLLERLGRGGYGEVWKCEAPGGIQKAIKFVFGDMEGFGNSGEAAEQEYRSLNRVKTIRHPFVLSLERFDIIDGQLLIVMELADRNLWDRFNECVLSGLPGIPHDELFKYLEEAAEALDLMNGHYQIQHLDIKPQNLFLVHNHIKVADFGLAKDLEGARAAMTGGVTPTYAPPETFEGWVSRHSDQYSLAIVYQEMLTGRRPFNGSNTRQLIMQHMTAAPDLSPLNERNRAAVARALSKVPTDRFPTCGEFVKALKGSDEIPPFAEVLPGQLREMMTPRSTSKQIVPQAITPQSRRSETTDRPESSPPRKMPALVTPGSREKPALVTPAAARRQTTTPDSKTGGPTENPLSEQRGDGCLFPAVYIGLGGTGLKALSAMRAQLSLKFGRDRLPNVRWLAIDTDPSSVDEFLAGNSWEADEVVLARLQRPTHYLQHENMPSVENWLPNGLLYQLPRSFLTEGNRAFGRLAFCDHYRVIRSRIRTILESLSKSDCIAQTDKLTQLGTRGNMPRVYLIGSLAGGTASGIAIDLAYVIRKEISLLGLTSGQVLGMFSLPTVRRTNGYHNARATIREISYFDSPLHNYSTIFDKREGALSDTERPFRRCELVPETAGSSIDREAMGEHLANLTFAESFSPVGRTVHPDDAASPTSAFCLPTLMRAIWPHQTITDIVVSRLSRQILTEWAGPVNWGLRDHLRPLMESIWSERNLQPDQLCQLFEQSAQKEFGCGLVELITFWLQPFRGTERRGRDSDDLLNVVYQIIELLGRMGGEDEEQNPGKLSKLFRSTEKAWIAETDGRLITSIVSLIEQPGMRLPAADLLIRFLEERIGLEIEAADRRIGRMEAELTDEYTQLFSLTNTSVNSRASKLAKRLTSGEHSFREVIGILKSRIELVMHRRVLEIYKGLAKNIPDYVREVELCRKQLIVYSNQIADPISPKIKAPNLTRLYFGERAENASQISEELSTTLPHEARQDLEQTLQAKIRHEGRGLVKMCVNHQEFGKVFLQLLREQTRRAVEPVIVEFASRNATWDANGQKLISKMLTETYRQFSDLSSSIRPSITVAGLPVEARQLRLVQFVKDATSGIPFVPIEMKGEMWVYRECRGIDPLRILDEASETSNLEAPNDDDFISATKHARCDVVWTT